MNAPNRFRTRNEAQRTSRRAWICAACMGKHDHAVKVCEGCGSSAVHYFASQKEARRFVRLLWDLKEGEITDLEVHPAYVLHAFGGEPVAKYVADFRYRKNGVIVIEDVKATANKAGLDPLFVHKRKHMRAEYGIDLFCNSKA
jgi:hypothetical protein